MQMVMFMRVNGIMTKLKVEERTSTLTAPNILVIGKMIKLTAMVNTSILMEPSMLAIGLKTNSMALELKYGQIVLNMKEIISMEKKTAKGHSTGQMDRDMKASF